MRAIVRAGLGAAMAVAIALCVPNSADPEFLNPKLRDRPAARDADGRILAWYRPEEQRGYDHVVPPAWDCVERKAPRDRRWGTGLPVYLVSSVYDGGTLQGSYWQHNPASL